MSAPPESRSGGFIQVHWAEAWSGNHALEIPEILGHIAEYLPDAASRLSFALTCRAWTHPGLRTIWYDIHHINLLFHWMSVNPLYLDWLQWPLSYPPITAEQWTSTFSKAKKVRTIALPVRIPFLSKEQKATRVASLANRPPGCRGYLLPGLESIYLACQEPHGGVCGIAADLCPPTLDRLTLEFGKTGFCHQKCGMRTMIESTKLASLRHLRIDRSPWNTPESVQRLAASHNNLTSLHINDPSLPLQSSFPSLFSLSKLEELCIAPTKDEATSYQLRLPAGTFPQLRAVTADIGLLRALFTSSETVVHLEKIMVVSKLKGAYFKNREVRLLQEVVTAAGAQCKGLQTFSIDVPTVGGYNEWEENCRHLSLLPLAACLEMRHISISMLIAALDYVDETLGTLSAHWPLLRSLHITGHYAGAVRIPTITGIKSLMQGCGGLETLTLPVSFHVTDAAELVDIPPMPHLRSFKLVRLRSPDKTEWSADGDWLMRILKGKTEFNDTEGGRTASWTDPY